MGDRSPVAMGRNAASGSMAGNKFWEVEGNNKGMAMMKGMGWSKGEGLGQKGTGSTEYLRATKRPDNRGIGATTSSDNMWCAAIGDVYNNVLAKLNKKHGAAAQNKAKDDEDESSSDEEEVTVKKSSSEEEEEEEAPKKKKKSKKAESEEEEEEAPKK